MQDINEAFEVLSNPEKRQLYCTVWLQKTGSREGATVPSSDRPISVKRQAKTGGMSKRFLSWGIIAIFLIGLGVVFFVINEARAPGSPDVKIQSIALTSSPQMDSGDLVYIHTFRIINNESYDMRLYWEGNSSLTGKLDSGYVTVLKNSYRDITRNYSYAKNGMEEVTYSIYYNGNLLDTYFTTHDINQ